MNNLKIKGFDNLEKDPVSGAVLLTPSNTATDVKLDYLVRKIKSLEKQNEDILQLLKDILNKFTA